MKVRWVFRYTITYPDGDWWWGTCPVWAARPLPSDAVITRERVKVIGPLLPCTVRGCTSAHANPGLPEVVR